MRTCLFSAVAEGKDRFCPLGDTTPFAKNRRMELSSGKSILLFATNHHAFAPFLRFVIRSPVPPEIPCPPRASPPRRAGKPAAGAFPHRRPRRRSIDRDATGEIDMRMIVLLGKAELLQERQRIFRRRARISLAPCASLPAFDLLLLQNARHRQAAAVMVRLPSMLTSEVRDCTRFTASLPPCA